MLDIGAKGVYVIAQRKPASRLTTESVAEIDWLLARLSAAAGDIRWAA